MREAGVDLATVGVFSWALLEPEPGRYELDWLGRVLDRLADGGVGVDLATATASPPPWLPHRHPETPAGDGAGHAAVAGRPPGLLPELTGLPRARRAAQPHPGRAVR